MIYQMGERVAINLDIDGYKKGENVIFGFVSQCKIYEKKLPGTLNKAVLIVSCLKAACKSNITLFLISIYILFKYSFTRA